MTRMPLVGLLALACGRAEVRGPRSAVLVTLDTTRADALSCYGNPEATTPHLDALAREGVVFDAAHTVVPLTLPAHVSMLTGLFPPRHGLRDNGAGALPESAETLATRAQAAGLATAAFVSSVVLDEDFGLARGFARYSVPERRGAAERAHGAERPARATIDAALAWLAEQDPARPFFLWVHLYDPHHPYAPPAEFAGRFSSPYLGEVAALDHELGRLFAALRARASWDETFVLALSDHGEAFGEHGEVSHGVYCYQTTLRIPWIARWPASARTRAPGTRTDELVSVVDVAPTLVEALGLEPLAGVDGTSVFARPGAPGRGVYFESYYAYLNYGWSPLAGWMDARGKYVHSAEPELYDWKADPGEARERSGERPAELERYRGAIARVADAPALAVAPLGAGDEHLEALQALGYAGAGEVGAELPHPLASSALPSPRSQVGFFAQQARAQALAAAGDRAGAAAVYAEVVRAAPGNHFAVDELAELTLELGRAVEAVELLTRLCAEGPPRARNFHRLGTALLAAERPAEAVAPLARAVELSNGRPRYLEVLREVLARLGRTAESDALEARYRENPSDE
jgi:arylsulfatase A-like enzyme